MIYWVTPNDYVIKNRLIIVSTRLMMYFDNSHT